MRRRPAGLPADPAVDLRAQFGGIDIYLFDQLLRGRLPAGGTVLDAGCGDGRNLVYLLRAGYRVLGADADPEAVAAVRRLAADLAPGTPAAALRDAFRAEPVEAMSFPDGVADVVVSSAVLHFARDADHFWAMLRGTWRVLRPGGLLFCRLAGRAGQEAARPLGGGRYALPDGTDRFLADEALLLAATAALGGELLDPLKTTVVHGRRSMTTWVVRRDA
jgi:SAM-dependent methyltransferase